MTVSLNLGFYRLRRHSMLVIGTLRMTLLSRFESACAISRTRRSGGRWKSSRVCFALPQRKNRHERVPAEKTARVRGLMLYSAMRLASWYPIYPPDSRAGLQTVRGGLTAVDHSMRSDLVAKSQSMKAIFIHTSVERTRLLKLFSSVNRQRTHNRGPKGKV